ncbi:MAG TPA: L-serine ammonia-lyase [Rhodothermales bacterium]|nr:L-serine ammonia-lyase [Rhodothermales bacterium]
MSTTAIETISVFDMLKIGVGPSSSHTLGPWRAVQRWVEDLREEVDLAAIDAIRINLYGSLALTGRGHCTDQAICLALLGYDPETVPVESISKIIDDLCQEKIINLSGERSIDFDPVADIVYLKSERLPFHANGMTCSATVGNQLLESTYYSIGGGFVVKEGEEAGSGWIATLPYPCQQPAELLAHCTQNDLSVAEMVWANEQAWRSKEQVRVDILRIWDVMKNGIYRGCHTQGMLPGGLHVKRRAFELNDRLLGEVPRDYANTDAWIATLQQLKPGFNQVMKWVSCFALAVNEENASLGRVVTAPTNGAAGVIPAVLLFHVCFSDQEVTDDDIANFLLVAGEIGSFFKKRATISAAMGGCQAEIGVSSAMAAAALAEALGGSVAQALMAAEIAMEHHLGMTCDPIGGLVQVPCIERNSMGAIKAINAAGLALESDPAAAKVTLDEVIQTMWETAKDMSSKYKETSQGGLAVNISVRVPEC